VYDDVMFKSMPMPGVKLPEPDSDEEDDTQTAGNREPGVSAQPSNRDAVVACTWLRRKWVCLGGESKGIDVLRVGFVQ
jgi:hypothetical protein